MTQMQLKRTLETSIGGLWGAEPAEGEAGIAVVRVADFDYPNLTVSTAPTTRVIEGHLARPRTLREGDLLIEKSGGGDQQNVGRVVRWVGGDEATFSNFINLLRPAPGFNPRWLAYLHRHLYLTGAQASCTKQTTGIQNLDLGAYLAIRVEVPAVDEQEYVADFLDRECERITELDRECASLVEGSLGPALARFDELSRDWDQGRIGYRFSVQLGKMLDEKRINPDDVRPYLRNANVQWDHLVLEDLKGMTFSPGDRARYDLRPGDLLVCEGGQPGRSAIWEDQVKDCYFQKALMRVRPRMSGDSTRYLMWCLRLASERGDFAANGTGTTILHLPAERLIATRVPLPPPDMQREILREVGALAQRGSSVAAEVQKLRGCLAEYRDALIAEAVTGRLGPTRLSDRQLDESAQAAMGGERPGALLS